MDKKNDYGKVKNICLKKKYITLALTFILAFCSTLKAEIVKELVIEGNNRISEETIKLYGEIELNNDYSEIQLNQIIKNLYSTNFFRKIDVKIKNNILRISVEEYPVINQLIFVGEKKKSL